MRKANVWAAMTNPAIAFVQGTKQILVVDDDPSVREMLARVLESDGHLARSAANENEARMIVAGAPIDLVLLDLGLPGKDGWETFGSLRRQNPRLAVIIITARTNQRANAVAAGADALFEKPLDFGDLLQMVRKLLSEPPCPVATNRRTPAARLGHPASPGDT